MSSPEPEDRSRVGRIMFLGAAVYKRFSRALGLGSLTLDVAGRRGVEAGAWRAPAKANAMTLFEYVTVAVSIVLSLGVIRLLDGVHFAASRERGYWVHFLWIVTKLFNHALYWWGLWSAREAVAWNFAWFVWVLLFPGTLYLQSTALVTTTPSEIVSWRDHFYRIRRWFFSINIALILHVVISTRFLVGLPLLDRSRLPLLIVFVLNLVGIASANPRLHAAIAIVTLLRQILGFGRVWFEPGAPFALEGPPAP